MSSHLSKNGNKRRNRYSSSPENMRKKRHKRSSSFDKRKRNNDASPKIKRKDAKRKYRDSSKDKKELNIVVKKPREIENPGNDDEFKSSIQRYNFEDKRAIFNEKRKKHKDKHKIIETIPFNENKKAPDEDEEIREIKPVVVAIKQKNLNFLKKSTKPLNKDKDVLHSAENAELDYDKIITTIKLSDYRNILNTKRNEYVPTRAENVNEKEKPKEEETEVISAVHVDFAKFYNNKMKILQINQEYDQKLQTVLRQEDPLLQYFLTKKQFKRQKSMKSGKTLVQESHLDYRIGPFQSMHRNRYDIMPGSLWDGVDRSNGFEMKLFNAANKKLAINDEKYKWQTEDM
ncbi:hypothetical protein A3Q56_07292 [Intoshia linei]|uniref:BUD13 homolog n=1 Tax=Intoshia linei TaxID=1819745 RepID=A0A177AUC0_9BILA|nr:hypothetical protein A3Q56_07292 [Intoshia linei]